MSRIKTIFNKKPRIIVAQPGSHHLWQTALACQQADTLKYYVTGVYYQPNKFPYCLIKILPAKLRAQIISQFKKRYHEELDQSKIKTYGFYEWLHLLSNRLIKLKSFSRRLVDKRNKNFSAKTGNLAKKQADILWSGMDASLDAFLIAKPKGVKYVLDEFIGHPLVLNKILDQEIKLHPELKAAIKKEKIPLERVENLCQEIQLADVIAAGSEFVKKTLLENNVPENKIAVIPYGADIERFRPKPKFTEDDSLFKILFVGNISVRKGCYYLLEAIKQINKPNIKLTMLGELENEYLLKYFKKRFKRYFKWMPPIPHYQMRLFFNKADIYVFPSLFEGSSISIYEAMASGLPVITTPNSGSVVRNQKDGFIVPIRDIEALKEKILLLYNNKVLRQKMAKNASQQAENYTWENYRRKVRELIKKIYQ